MSSPPAGFRQGWWPRMAGLSGCALCRWVCTPEACQARETHIHTAHAPAQGSVNPTLARLMWFHQAPQASHIHLGAGIHNQCKGYQGAMCSSTIRIAGLGFP